MIDLLIVDTASSPTGLDQEILADTRGQYHLTIAMRQDDFIQLK